MRGKVTTSRKGWTFDVYSPNSPSLRRAGFLVFFAFATFRCPLLLRYSRSIHHDRFCWNHCQSPSTYQPHSPKPRRPPFAFPLDPRVRGVSRCSRSRSLFHLDEARNMPQHRCCCRYCCSRRRHRVCRESRQERPIWPVVHSKTWIDYRKGA